MADSLLARAFNFGVMDVLAVRHVLHGHNALNHMVGVQGTRRDTLVAL